MGEGFGGGGGRGGGGGGCGAGGWSVGGEVEGWRGGGMRYVAVEAEKESLADDGRGRV